MNPKERETLDIVTKIICRKLSLKDDSIVLPKANLTNDLKADSLDVVELIMIFEETFNIVINDEVVGKMVTIQDIVDYIVAND